MISTEKLEENLLNEKLKNDNFSPNNIVMCSSLSEEVFLDAVLQLLPCVPVDFRLEFKNGKAKRKIIPYFNEEGIIISVKYKNEYRGIRTEGGQFPTAIGVDLQNDCKNMYVKISGESLQLCGALSYQMGINAFNIILEYINMVNDHWKYFNLLSEEKQINTIDWLLSILIKDDNINKKNIAKRSLPKNSIKSVIPIPDPIPILPSQCIYMWDDPKIIRNFENAPKNIDIRIAKYLAMFTYDFPTYNKFYARIEKMLDLMVCENNNICYFKQPILKNPYIALGVYNYKYPVKEKISLIKTCMYLYKLGYGAIFCNFMGPKVLKVMLPLNMIQEVDENIILTDSAYDICNSPDDEDDDYVFNDEQENIEEQDEEIDNNNENNVNEQTDKKVDKNENDDKNTSSYKFKGANRTRKIIAHRFEIKQNGSIKQTSPSHVDIAFQIKQLLYNDLAEFLGFEKM